MIVSSARPCGVSRVQRRVEIDDHFQLAERAGREGRVRVRAVQVAAQAKAKSQPPRFGCFHAGHCVQPRRGGQLDAKMILQAVEHRVL